MVAPWVAHPQNTDCGTLFHNTTSCFASCLLSKSAAIPVSKARNCHRHRSRSPSPTQRRMLPLRERACSLMLFAQSEVEQLMCFLGLEPLQNSIQHCRRTATLGSLSIAEEPQLSACIHQMNHAALTFTTRRITWISKSDTAHGEIANPTNCIAEGRS